MLNDKPYDKFRCLSRKSPTYSINFLKNCFGYYSVHFRNIAQTGPAFCHRDNCICSALKGAPLSSIQHLLVLNILIVDNQGDVLLVRKANVWEAVKLKYDAKLPINQFIKQNLNNLLVTEFSKCIKPNAYMGFKILFIQEMILEHMALEQGYGYD